MAYVGQVEYQTYSHIESRIKAFGNYTVIGKDESGTYDMYKIELGSPGKPVLFFLASLHGTEWHTTQYTLSLAEMLENNTFPDADFRNNLLSSYHLVIIPVGNPYGLDRVTNEYNQFDSNARTNSNGIDLNRDFYDITQQETINITNQILRHRPFAFLDSHMFQPNYSSANGMNLILANGQRETDYIRDRYVDMWKKYTGEGITVWVNDLSPTSGLARAFAAKQTNPYTPNTLSYISEMKRPAIIDGVLIEELTKSQIYDYGIAALTFFIESSIQYLDEFSIEEAVVEALTVTDLLGNEEMLVDFKEYTRTRKVNGEKTISMTVVPSEANKHAFPLIGEEATITHGNDEYIIKKYSAKSIGNKYIKRIDAVHKFYVDLINKQQNKVHNGSITFFNYMNLVFENTGYTFAVIDSFPALSFENLGNDNRLSLLEKGLDRFQAEMEIVGNQVRFRKRVGNDTDFQFRYGHNINSIEESCETTNLATVIRGEGADGITAYYRSPNADIFGELDAPSVIDERFTSKESLLEEMKSRLEDTPLFSTTIDFADLRAAGYPYTVPNEGDRVFVIYEPMDDLLIEARILDINEVFDADLKPIKTTVTLANHKKSFADVVFDNTQKQLGKIVNEDGVVRNDVLSEAMRIAAESIKNARTELQFPNEGGIWAVEKDDPNKVVVFNSAGLAVSTDNMQTIRSAITAEGVVAETIMAGLMQGVNIVQDDGEGGKIELVNGVLQTYLNNTRVMRVDDKGLTMFSADGGVEAGTLRDSQLTGDKSKKGISLNSARDFLNIGFGSVGETARPVLHAQNGIETRLYIGREFSFEALPGQTRLYVDGQSVFRADHTGTTIYNNKSGMAGTSMLWADHNDDRLKLYYKLSPLYNGRFEMYGNLMVDGYVSADDYRNNSLIELKDNIKPVDFNASDLLRHADIMEYMLKKDIEKGSNKKRYGFIIGDGYNIPEEILGEDKKGISSYAHSSINSLAIKEQIEKTEKLEKENKQLRDDYNALLKRIEALEKR
ncbi:hypothetical protein AQ616_18910 [Oceanobacillus sp. E9]|uniref:phage tail protein n=1 Tax=Oceanobacillus sp. E9 TaxID=1742575 RepID=UPI00084E494D|nr:phage tail protein [Oceanobacillus sp. E9]OEH52976.1 hypothetical protein AQ616_18910 [Oceanobacillus sp. E9]